MLDEQIQALQTIEALLTQIIDSEEYQQLRKSGYQPDLFIEDAATAVCYLLNHLETFNND